MAYCFTQLKTWLTIHALAFLSTTAMRQVRTIRQQFLRAALRQEVAFYDTKATGGEAVALLKVLCKGTRWHNNWTQELVASVTLCAAYLTSHTHHPPCTVIAHMLQCISDDCSVLQRAMGEKLGLVLNSLSSTITGLVLGGFLGPPGFPQHPWAPLAISAAPLPRPGPAPCAMPLLAPRPLP